MITETLRGVALIHRLRELESKNIPVRSVTVGKNPAEWLLAWDGPASGDPLPLSETQGAQGVSDGDGSGRVP